MGVKIILPMPDFSLRKANEFEGINKEDPLDMTKSVSERLPLIPKHLHLWSAFETKLHTGQNPPPSVALTAIDWEFHQKALKKNRLREAQKRVNERVSIEEGQRDLFDENFKIQEAKLRALIFAERMQNQQNATERQKKSNHKAIAIEDRHFTAIIAARDMEIARRRIRFFLQEQVPTKHLFKELVEKFLLEPTKTQLALVHKLEEMELQKTQNKNYQIVKRFLAESLLQSLHDRKYWERTIAHEFRNQDLSATQNQFVIDQSGNELARTRNLLLREYGAHLVEQKYLADRAKNASDVQKHLAEMVRRHYQVLREIEEEKAEYHNVQIDARSVLVQDDPVKHLTQVGYAHLMARAEERSKKTFSDGMLKRIEDLIQQAHATEKTHRQQNVESREAASTKLKMYSDPRQQPLTDRVSQMLAQEALYDKPNGSSFSYELNKIVWEAEKKIRGDRSQVKLLHFEKYALAGSALPSIFQDRPGQLDLAAQQPKVSPEQSVEKLTQPPEIKMGTVDVHLTKAEENNKILEQDLAFTKRKEFSK